MDRKLFGIFSGRQLTAIAITAILAPSALYAAVAATAVSITDPNTGQKSFVDAARRLSVYDATGGLRATPANAVNIVFNLFGSTSLQCYSVTYPIPSGKALVLTTATGYHSGSSSSYSQSTLWDAADCGGSSGKILTTSATSATQADIAQDFGNGIVIPAGKTLGIFPYNDAGITIFHGYLVPAGQVPSAAAADAAYQGVPVTGATARRAEGGRG